jgi:hypothetical protein
MIRHARLVAAAAIALAMGLGSLALAQPSSGKRAGRTRAKPAPAAPSAIADAAVDARPVEEEKDRAALEATAAAAAAEVGDGAVRASPLDPAPGELPGTSPLDGGAIDYDRLLSDIAALRTRVAAVGESLFQSRMAIAVRVDGDRYRVAKLAVSVDDGVVYTSPPGFRADDFTPVFARAHAPGRHAVTLDVEREDRENVAFRTAQRSRFVVEVPRDEVLDVSLRVEDDSSMGDLPGKKKGEYDLRVRMKATSSPIKR